MTTRKAINLKEKLSIPSESYNHVKAAIEEVEKELFVSSGPWVMKKLSLRSHTEDALHVFPKLQDPECLLNFYIHHTSGNAIAFTRESNGELRFLNEEHIYVFYPPAIVKNIVESEVDKVSPETFAKIWKLEAKTPTGRKKTKTAIANAFLGKARKNPLMLLDLLEL